MVPGAAGRTGAAYHISQPLRLRGALDRGALERIVASARPGQARLDVEISIRTVFSMLRLEAMPGEIERRIHEDVAALSDFETGQLTESNPTAGV